MEATSLERISRYIPYLVISSFSYKIEGGFIDPLLSSVILLAKLCLLLNQ